jgi:hypothetical protein
VSDLLSAARRQLVGIDGFAAAVFASHGREAIAIDLATRACRAWDWLSDICEPSFSMPSILVLDAGDWSAFAPVPVYGMPQAWSDRLVVPATASDLFDDFTETILPSLSAEHLEALSRWCGMPPDIGVPTSRLAVAHEVGHFFHDFDDSGWVGFARHWIAELFANVAMYGYFVEREPEELPVLDTICAASAAARPAAWSAHEIQAMGGGSPSGYIWAQFQFIVLAKQIWQRSGAAAFSHFHRELREPSLTDEEIIDALRTLDAGVAASVERWPDVSSD